MGMVPMGYCGLTSDWDGAGMRPPLRLYMSGIAPSTQIYQVNSAPVRTGSHRRSEFD
jgi:hypothetical protein